MNGWHLSATLWLNTHPNFEPQANDVVCTRQDNFRTFREVVGKKKKHFHWKRKVRMVRNSVQRSLK